MGIYVEIEIRGTMDELWAKTQEPAVHQRWDLRFSEIIYLPLEPGQPQQSVYATRIGGMKVAGGGESTGTRDSASGERTSALKFWSADKKAIIKEGSGYWKYRPCENAITFLTWYDYQPRWGLLGMAVDRGFFRPLMGWATAWSFDRLRLWIESGVTPEASLTAALIYALARTAVAFVWFYHGVVPKLLFRSPDELAMVTATGLYAGANVLRAVKVVGIVEIIWSLVVLLLWRAQWPLWLTIVGMVAALISVGMRSPSYLTSAFNAVTLNLSVIVLSGCALLAHKYVPTANNCLRQPVKKQ